MVVLAILGVVCGAIGTFSSEYTIKKVSFTNETFYNKIELYGETFLEDTYGPEYAGLSLKTSYNRIFSMSAYEITPTGYPEGTKFPTIIWSHGMIANNEIQLNYALEFAAAGFKVIAMGLEGHGSNGGLWDLGVTDFQTVFAAVEYAASLPDVNTSAIGISGHSNGGYSTTRAGIFDKTEIGTGGLIRSVGSIWTISDFQETLEWLVGANPVGNPQYSWLIPLFMGVNHPSGTIETSDVLIRSVSDYINTTNIPNWCLISGTMDEFSPPSVMYNAMSVASGQTSTDLMNAIAAVANETWDNLDDPLISFEDGTARRLIMHSGLDHIAEAFDPRMPQELVDWFIISMNLDPSQHLTRMEQGIPVMYIWVARYAGMIFLILAFVVSQLVVGAYLAPVMFPEQRLTVKSLKHKEEENVRMSEIDVGYLTPGLQEFILDVEYERTRDLFTLFRLNWKNKTKFWIGLSVAFIIPIAVFWIFNQSFFPFTRFWVFNAYLWQFILIGISVWILALVTYVVYRRSRKYGQYVNLKRVGASWTGLKKGFIYSIIVFGGPFIILNILLNALALPVFWPRAFDSTLWLEVLLGCLIIWFLYIPLETLVKTQLFPIMSKFKSKGGYWLEIIINAFLVMLIWVLSYALGIFFMTPEMLQMVRSASLTSGAFGGVLFIAIVAIKPLINGVITFITAFFYQRTRNLFACSFYPVFIWFMIIFCKFAGIFAAF